MKKLINYFTKTELILWITSILVIIFVFLIFKNYNFLSLIASLIGVTSLIFSAKGNHIGQLLMIFFSLLYGIISYSFSYFGEMITYLGMTMPMAVFALVSWLKNPYNGNKSQVKINYLQKKELVFMCILALFVTVIFYFILDYFNTANIIASTLSVTTSFIAVYLTFRRTTYFAIAYAINDIILIYLWTMATFEEISYLSVVVCFIIFLFNDVYGFMNWCRMAKLQK